MSNALRYDALLTRDLAGELDHLLRGVRLDGILFDRDLLRIALITRSARRADPLPPSLLWQLHPDSGHLTRIATEAAAGMRIALPSRPTIIGIAAPPDERIIDIRIAADDGAAGATRRLVIELVTNQWNAIAVGEADQIVAVLRERRTRQRVLAPGETYAGPAASARLWIASRPTAGEWTRTLLSVPAGERLSLLTKRAAYASPLNAAAIVGDADVSDAPDALERARSRYLDIVHDAPREAVLLAGGHAQPYSVRLSRDDAAVPRLADAFERAAEVAAAVPAAPAALDVALAAAAHRMDQLEQRIRRLRAEQSGADEDAQQLRREADLLLSQLHRVSRGAAEVELDDFAGGTIVVALEPTLSAADNATRLYDAARKRARASRRIPELVRAAERELTRVRDLVARVRDGAAGADEIMRFVPRATSTGDVAKPLPYRVYRTTAGHEVRVGRGARANDELTFRHASPNDIWLHARDVAGAHVVLRWTRADENPSARDIAEAAVLAALHSRARTSGTVAVDWTRRKYVRKPRKSAPGVVVPERVKTVFVEPDGSLEERLRAQP